MEKEMMSAPAGFVFRKLSEVAAAVAGPSKLEQEAVEERQRWM